MIAIGIDPGIERTGIGIVESKTNKLELLHQELILTSSINKDPFRLNEIFEKVSLIIKNYKIDFAVIEKLFFAKNVKTAFRVSEVRGVILLALEKFNLPIYEYTPLQIKQGLIGYGRGTKQQIQELVKLILCLDEYPKSDDVADGIACAIVGLNSYRTISRIKGNVL
jgi:crossover junction endodeoxyribonuclease RuvC